MHKISQGKLLYTFAGHMVLMKWLIILISEGADDSIRNRYGFTSNQGLRPSKYYLQNSASSVIFKPSASSAPSAPSASLLNTKSSVDRTCPVCLDDVDKRDEKSFSL